MRRLDRDNSTNEAVIGKCIEESQVIRLALNDETSPYVIPLCFGHEVIDGRRFFYFHKNRDGRLARMLESCPVCTFELEGDTRLFLDWEKMMCNMDYCSVIGRGRVSLIETEAERDHAMDVLMAHYGRGDFAYDKRAMKAILMYRLEADELTCKATRGWRTQRGC